MGISKVKALAVVLTIAAAASAQFNGIENARTRALGGAPLSDISGIYSYPVLMLDYLDHAQVTWNGTANGTGLGSFIFTKSINDMISLGVVYTPEGFLQNTSFSGASINTVSGSALPTTPHLLLGFDLDIIKLGADIFFQHNGEVTESEASGVNSKTTQRVMNFGTRVSGAMELGDIGVMAKLGFGVPSLFYEQKTSATTTKLENNGIYLEMGAEVSYPISGMDLTGGLEYTMVNHQQDGNTAAGLPYPKGSTALFSLYLFGEVNIIETAAAVFGYSYTNLSRATINTTGSGTPVIQMETKTVNTDPAAHSFYAGVENAWDNVWKFDNLQLRTGLNYSISHTASKMDNDQNDDFNKSKLYASRDFAKPIIGLGVSKGLFTLDMALSFGRMFDGATPNYEQWRGWMAGPTMAAATATIKF